MIVSFFLIGSSLLSRNVCVYVTAMLRRTYKAVAYFACFLNMQDINLQIILYRFSEFVYKFLDTSDARLSSGPLTVFTD